MGADTAERVPVSGTLMWCGSPVLVCASLTLLGDARPGPVVPLGLKPKTKHVLFAFFFFLFLCLFYLIFSAKTGEKAGSDGQQLYFPPHQVSSAAHLLGAVVLVLPPLSSLFSSPVVCCDRVTSKGAEVYVSCFISQQALFSAQLGGDSWCWCGGSPSRSAISFSPCKAFPPRPKAEAKCVLGAVAPGPRWPADLETSGNKSSAVLVENWCSHRVGRKHVSKDGASCSAWEGEWLAQGVWRREASQSWSALLVLMARKMSG